MESNVAKKLYYKIGEACKLLDIKPFVLRYWETEFPVLSPNKSKSGQRIYSEPDLEIIRRINELLNVEGYTIAGARKKLQSEIDSGGPEASGKPPAPAARKKAAKKSPAGAAPAALDNETGKQVEKLRTGVEAALSQTRSILELLGSQAG